MANVLVLVCDAATGRGKRAYDMPAADAMRQHGEGETAVVVEDAAAFRAILKGPHRHTHVPFVGTVPLEDLLDLVKHRKASEIWIAHEKAWKSAIENVGSFESFGAFKGAIAAANATRDSLLARLEAAQSNKEAEAIAWPTD